MPTLKKNTPTKKSTNRQPTDMRRLRQKAYQSSEWKKLRDIYMKEHPVCEECLAKGKITPAVDIHHKESPFKNNEVNKSLLLDYNNLQALCKECHGDIHNRQQGRPTIQDVLRQLADLLDENIPDEYFDEKSNQ